MRAVGLDGNILRWVSSFLTDRTHQVCIGKECSGWLPVLSGVPQGSVLGPALFLVYINDIGNNLKSTVSLFADDAKVYRILKVEEDVDALKRDMKYLGDWSGKWLLTFNTEKCKTMHIGRSNQQADYQLNGSTLGKSSQEKDLGIVVANDLKSSVHVTTVSVKANSVLTKDILLPLYLSLVCPILDYGDQSWSLYLVQDIQAVERVQRRATKLVPGLTQLPYESRCQCLGLQTLEEKRVRGDISRPSSCCMATRTSTTQGSLN